MKTTLFSAILAFGALGVMHAQQPAAPQTQPGQTQGSPQGSAQGQGGWQGQRGGRGAGGGFGMGRGTIGTVTEVAADHYTIKTELGEIYTVHFSANTRILKQAPGEPGRRQGRGAGAGQGQGSGQGSGQGAGGNGDEAGMARTPPQPIKATDIKVGDVITAGGEVDANAKSVGAVFVMLIDPERAKEMRAMEANFGKTWLAGRVTAINETKVNLESGPERGAHSFVADENTTFRKRRDPITLADVQVGDMVRVEGAVKDGTFVATSVAVMGAPPNGPRENGAGPGQPPAPQQ
jgi:hypothetical protein